MVGWFVVVILLAGLGFWFVLVLRRWFSSADFGLALFSFAY